MDSEDKRENIFPVKCPFQRLSRTDGKLYRCNALCVRVKPGSEGEARCRKCRLKFNFECNQEGVINAFVNAKSTDSAE